MKTLLRTLLLFLCLNYISALYYDTRKVDPKVDPGEALLLTPLINQGKISEAQQKARVRQLPLAICESYSGYITFNKKYNSNTFFWFFPSQTNPKEDPVVLWFIGGPALSFFISLFVHNGPYIFHDKYFLVKRNYTLARNHSVIYIDNPVGTGYSYTENIRGFARNQADVARDTIAFLLQFFQLFPQYRENDFYVGGDSYGGKYVATVGNALRKHNYESEFYINLRGILMGNGLIDFEIQSAHHEFLYQTGFVDRRGRDILTFFENRDEQYIVAYNLTGYTEFSNMLDERYVYETGNLVDYAQSNEFRRAIHAGNKEWNQTSFIARFFFENVAMFPVTGALQELLRHNYRVLVYNGQLDMMFPYIASINLYESLNWSEAQTYKEVKRDKWWVDGELAGYVKVAGNFYEVLMRDAGHVTFYDNPKWSTELVTRYTHFHPIAGGQPKNAKPVRFRIKFI